MPKLPGTEHAVAEPAAGRDGNLKVSHHVQFKDPVFGFLVMLEKAGRGKLPQIGSAK